jgi:hypothetical protein
MFLDHYKPAYTTDLKLCEELKLVTPGSVLAADNVIKPGNPPYLEYVRSTVQEKKKKVAEGGKGGSVEGFAERNVKQYAKRQGEEKFAQSAGNPNLVYKSELVNSYEPTGVPVCSVLRKVRAELTRFRMVLKLRGVLARSNREMVSICSRVVINKKWIGLMMIIEWRYLIALVFSNAARIHYSTRACMIDHGQLLRFA